MKTSNHLYFPKIVATTYQRKLLSVVAQWKAIVDKYMVGNVERWLAYNTDSPADELQYLTIELERQMVDIVNSQVPNYATTAYNETDRIYENQWARLLKYAIGVSLLLPKKNPEERRKLFSLTNVGLMGKLASEIVADMQTAIINGMRTGQTIAQIKEQASKVWAKARNRARLIGRDQPEKLYGELNKSKQEQYKVSEYIWMTMQDEKVRDTHYALNGKICQWNDSSVVKSGDTWINRSSINAFSGIPGQDYNCRCVAYPIFTDEIIQLAGGEAPKTPKTKFRMPTFRRR